MKYYIEYLCNNPSQVNYVLSKDNDRKWIGTSYNYDVCSKLDLKNIRILRKTMIINYDIYTGIVKNSFKIKPCNKI